MSLRQQKKIEVRDRILTVCGRLFRSRGFDETTVVDIIEAAGISRQTFFNYFTGKQAVLTELGLAWLREQAEVPRLGPGTPKAGSIVAGTRNAIRGQLRAIKADAGFMRVVFTRSGLLFPQEQSMDKGLERIRADHTRPIFEAIARVMRAAQEAGEVRSDIDPLQVAEMYVSVMLMTIRLWLIGYWQDGVDLEDRAMRALDVLEAGLAPPETIGGET